MTSRTALYQSPLLVLLLIALGASPTLPAHAQFFRPSAELRVMHTETFDVQVQKNGRVDIVLRSGLPLIENAEPLIWFADEDEPEAMDIDGRATMREEFKDRLGTGQAMRFVQDGSEWIIRVYPLRAYVTVQSAYTNETKRPQTVRALYPWSCGMDRDGGVVLGAATDESLALGWPADGAMSGAPPRTVRARDSGHAWQSLVYNPATGRSILAGFLTVNRAMPSVTIAPSPEERADQLAFAAQCVFNPPVELAPGERIESEVLFLTFTDPNPFRSLERFGQAFAVSNGLRPNDHPPLYLKRVHAETPDALARQLEHIPANESTRPELLLNLETAASLPLHSDWNAVLDTHSETDFGIRATPLTEPAESDIIQRHPSWYLPSESGERVLDITGPGATDHVIRFLEQAERFTALDLGTSTVTVMTTATANAEGITQLRAAFETAADGTPLVLAKGAPYLAGLIGGSIYGDAPAVPRTLSGPAPQLWSAAEALAGAVRSYFIYPFLCRPALSPPTDMSTSQQQAWFTAAGLLGATIVLPEEGTFDPAIVDRALPVMDRPARPADLLSEDHPRIWHRLLESDDDSVHLVALFNWSTAVAAETQLPLAQFGMEPGAYYTVFDFWSGQYVGTAGDSLAVSVPPNSVRLLGMRPMEERPRVAAYDGHIAMGGLHETEVRWLPETGVLQGRVNRAGAGRLHVVAPQGWSLTAATLNGEPVSAVTRCRAWLLDPADHNDGQWSWTLSFTAP